MQKPNKLKSQSKKDDAEAKHAIEAKKKATETEIRRWDRAAATALASLRRDRDLKQRELAEQLGVKRQRIANLEARRSPPGFGEVMVLALRMNTLPPQILELVTFYYRASAPVARVNPESRARRRDGRSGGSE